MKLNCLQKLRKLEINKWSEIWQMLFNFGKCKCLHTGPGNTGMNYEMGGTILSKTMKENDLGVKYQNNAKLKRLRVTWSLE